MPVFTGGKLRNNLRLAEATKQEMVLSYQKTIATAFRDVANALIAYQKSTERRIAQEKEVIAARESVRLSRVRYESGTTSYLEVLTNDANLFAAELRLASARQPEALSLCISIALSAEAGSRDDVAILPWGTAATFGSSSSSLLRLQAQR